MVSGPLVVLAVGLHLTAHISDNRADDLTKEGMLNGIQQAAAFILFLSTG